MVVKLFLPSLKVGENIRNAFKVCGIVVVLCAAVGAIFDDRPDKAVIPALNECAAHNGHKTGHHYRCRPKVVARNKSNK
ncbi:MAG: hypothetical protein Kow0031_08200 [Anaerolineae bacterium]